jgi:hypothetical protein
MVVSDKINDIIYKAALESKRLALAIETKFADSRSNATAPADFGEHEDIPEDAVVPMPISINSDNKYEDK